MKSCITPYENLKSYNFGIVEHTYKLFAPNREFLGSADLMVAFKLTPDHYRVFLRKIYNCTIPLPSLPPIPSFPSSFLPSLLLPSPF